MTQINLSEELREAIHQKDHPKRETLVRILTDYGVTPDHWSHDRWENRDDYEDGEYLVSVFSKNWTVAVYLSELAHGGSEEGGWWYEYGYLQDLPVLYFETRREAQDARNVLASLLDTGSDWNLNRRPMSSVISDGRFTAQVHHTHPPRSYPKERPRYS